MIDHSPDIWIPLCAFILSIALLYVFWKIGGFKLYREDHNKPIDRSVLTCGGAVVVSIISVFYIFVSATLPNKKLLFLLLSGVSMLAAVIGCIDDFKDIKIWKKVPLMLIPPIPLIIISIYHPLWENTSVLGINFGVFYWIFVVPIVYAGFSNGANIIAGYDGLEAGIFVFISSLFILISFLEGNQAALISSAILLAAVLAFEFYNWIPSKILLGNVGSFPIGGLIGLIALLGHFEIVLPIVFLPHLIEFGFKIKHRGHTSVFGAVDKNGIIHNKDETKSVLHWIISWGNMTEKKITLAMLGIEASLCAVAFFAYIFICPLCG